MAVGIKEPDRPAERFFETRGNYKPNPKRVTRREEEARELDGLVDPVLTVHTKARADKAWRLLLSDLKREEG